jgi:Zn-dependent protease with chaperone function
MSMKGFIACVLAGVLCFATFAVGRAQAIRIQEMGQDLYVQLRMDSTGEATLGAWSSKGGEELGPILPEVLHCQDDLRAVATGANSIRCWRALRSDGLALDAVLDLAPIAQRLNGAKGIELWVNCPRLGFESSSLAMTEEEDGPRVSRTVQFAAGMTPEPIKIRFGYRPDQLAGVYLPLLALALALTLIAAIMARAGFAGLALSEILLGTMLWMGATSLLQADAPLRILLFGTPLANFAALFVDLWPPLFCVAAGVALGSRLRGGSMHSGRFGDVFGSYAVIPLVLTCVVGALPPMNREEWAVVACWLAAAPAYLLLRRLWLRFRGRASVRQITTGELKDRISALALRAGCPQVKVYISFSARSRVANAFALPGRSIFLTAPLVRSLSKREVDAVAAHELSHARARYSSRGGWMALCMAMLFCETPAREFMYLLPGGLFAAIILPIIMFFAALHGSRKREFAADAKAAVLTGDPQAMISSLARIGRNNGQPLDMISIVEWFSSHPSTTRRIRALAAAARLETAEVEALICKNDLGEPYEIPAEGAGGDLFTLGWQKTNAGIFGWTVVFGSCGAGLLVAWLLEKFTGFRTLPILGGIALVCVLTKGVAATVMALNYARLRRKLEAKFGFRGRLVGFAADDVARIYNGYRFSDAGLLRFENGRLCYQSERTAIALNPADVLEVGMLAAAPSNWFRRQPMVRFRNPDSGQAHVFILHTVDWPATQRRLLWSIIRWKKTETSALSTSIDGFNPVAGQPFRNPTIAVVARGFLVTGGIALAVAIPTCWLLNAEWQYVGWVLALTACAYLSMLLPAMFYRPAMPVAEPISPAGAG